MTTDVIHSIGATNTPTTMDYTSLATWAAACPASLVTADERWVGEFYNQGELSVGTTTVTLSSSCSNTQCFVLRAATGQGFADQPSPRPLRYIGTSGAAITGNSGYASLLDSSGTVYCEIAGLQFYNSTTGGGGNGHLVFHNGSHMGGYIHDCILSTPAATHAFTSIYLWCNTYTSNVIENILTINESTGSTAIQMGTGSPGIIRNCTLVSIGGNTGGDLAPIRGDYNIVNAYNNAIFNLAPLSSVGAGSGTNNITDQATLGTGLTGTTGAAFSTANFVSLSGVTFGTGAGYDFRIPTGSALQNAGSTANGSTTDIFGTTRPQGTATDIGAYELPVATGAFTGSISDTAASSDSFTQAMAAFGSVTGTAASSDSFTSTSAFTGSVADTSATSDSFTGLAAGNYAGSFAGTAASSDTASGILASAGSFTGTAASSDNFTGVAAGTASLNDTAASSDSATVTMAAAGSFIGTAVSSDSFTGTAAGNYTGSISDNLASSDRFTAMSAFTGSVADTAASSDRFTGPTTAAATSSFFFGL